MFRALWRGGLIIRLIEVGVVFVGCLLPESKFKEFLRGLGARYHYRYHNPLYQLDRIIKEAQLLPDGILRVELYGSTILYGLPDRESHPAMKYGKPDRLGKIREFDHFGDFFIVLSEQYAYDAYEKYYKLKKGDIVVDVGANVGAFAVKAANEVGNAGKVVAIEPERDCLKLLRRNVQENRAENVVVVPKAVWSRRTRLKLYLSSFTSYHSLYNESFYKIEDSSEFEEVEVDTLDNILGELGIKAVDFIKIDIEGSEVEALRGMDEILAADVKLVMEKHVLGGKSTSKGIVRELKSRGFQVQEHGLIYARKE
jgi:FkbM family methyltransferase